MDVTEGLRAHAEEKAAKLARYYDGLQSASVTLDREGGQYLVEIVATGRRKSVFVAHHRDDDLQACLDQCLHKLAEQLRRHKDRVRDRHGPSHEQAQAAESEQAADEAESEEQ